MKLLGGAVALAMVATAVAACSSPAKNTCDSTCYASVVAAVGTPTVTATSTATATETVTGHPIVRRTIATHIRTVRVTYTPPPPKSFGDGTYVVGSDIKPGTYHSNGGTGYCAWIRARDPSGSNIIDLGNTSNGPLTVVVEPTDGSLVIQGNCRFHRM